MDAKQIKDLDLTYNLHSWSKQGSLDPMQANRRGH